MLLPTHLAATLDGVNDADVSVRDGARDVRTSQQGPGADTGRPAPAPAAAGPFTAGPAVSPAGWAALHHGQLAAGPAHPDMETWRGWRKNIVTGMTMVRAMLQWKRLPWWTRTILSNVKGCQEQPS